MGSRVREGFAAGADTYVRMVCALALNVPLLSLALTHHLEGVPLLSLPGLYAQLVFLGYYTLFLFVAVSAVFLVTAWSRRLAMLACGTVLFLALAYLLVNSIVHRVYRFHIDAFWIRYVFGSFSGMGVNASVIATLVAVLAGVALIEWGIISLVGRMRPRRLWSAGFAVLLVLAGVVSQAIHVFAYYRNDARITRITPQLPFYSPVVSQKHASRYDDRVSLGLEADAHGGEAATSLRYPLRAPSWNPSRPRPNIVLLLLESWRYDMMDSLITPHTWALSRRSSTFLDHFSSGNATPHGVFGLFFGIHPTYWEAVKANNAEIDNPVLVDVLQARQYAFGIFADSQFGRHKIKDSMFRGIDVHEQFAGATPDARDGVMTDDLIAFMQSEHREHRPFFGFAFYKSTHFSYFYPPASAKFQPAEELNMALAGNTPRVEPYLNDCRNSVTYVDSLVGRVVHALEDGGMMDETIVIVTSDHGEEFNDNRAGWWGHCGNFTRWQTQVPLVLYWPGRAPRRVTERTAHVDVPTTLLTEAFGCDSIRDWSNGCDLFRLPHATRPLVIGSYVNHAYVMGDGVQAIYPMFVQTYTLSDIHGRAAPPRPSDVSQILEETRRFYETAPTPARARTGVTAAAH
jgi:uncharacterized protein